MRKHLYTLFCTLICIVAAGGSALAAPGVVTFDNLSIGQTYDGSAGVMPGDLLFSEDGIDVYAQPFDNGGTNILGYAEVVDSFGSPRFFHDQNIMRTNGMCLLFVFDGYGPVSFEYLQLGGAVNIQVNEVAAVLNSPDLPSLQGEIAPGVEMSVVATAVPGGHKGTVTFSGQVDRLRIGGLEFWIDDVAGGGDTVPGDDCDMTITHETLEEGRTWGDGEGDNPGDIFFEESRLPVLGAIYTAPGGSQAFSEAVAYSPEIPGFGSGRALSLTEMAVQYPLSSAPGTVKRVSFDFFSQGGGENLQVNGEQLHVGNLWEMPAAVAAGVTMTVTAQNNGDGFLGSVVLTGPMDDLVVGGTKLMVDEFCIEYGLTVPADGCTNAMTFAPLSEGTVFGAGEGHDPGDRVYSEDDIFLAVATLTNGSNEVLGNGTVVSSDCAGTAHPGLHLEMGAVDFLLGQLTDPVYASFRFCDCGDLENLTINGTTWIGELADVPGDYFGPDIQVEVTLDPAKATCTSGLVQIAGPLDVIGVGGVDLFVDELCVSAGQDVAAVGLPGAAGPRLTSYPNPFNPATTISFELAAASPVEVTILDPAGRVVRRLLNETREAGPQAVSWNGRDDRGRTAAAGVYLVRLQTNAGASLQKIALIK